MRSSYLLDLELLMRCYSSSADGRIPAHDICACVLYSSAVLLMQTPHGRPWA